MSAESLDDERTPLVSGNGKVEPGTRLSWKRETKALWSLAMPMYVTHLLEYSIGGVTVVVTGHMGVKELDAASIAQLLLTTTTISPIIYGLSCALDTLANQAVASDNPKNTSLYVQRTGLIQAICMIPAGITLFFAERIFLAIGQDAEIARLAGEYIRVYMLSLPFLAAFELMRRWLLAQGKVNVPTYALLVAAPSSLVLNWLLVLSDTRFRLGFIGAPIATLITTILMFLVMLFYVYFFAPRTCYGGWSSAMFHDLGPNIRLGAAGAVVTCGDWIAWDAVSLASSYLSPKEFAANQVGVALSNILFQLPLSFAVSASIRVGNLLGAQLPRRAKLAAKVVWLSGIALGLMNVIVLLASRSRIGHLFTTDDQVNGLVADIIPLIAIFQIADCLTGSAQGILRGSGLAALAAQANIISYYPIGLPLGMFLCFRKDMGIRGLWLGLVVALIINASLDAFFVYRVDWQHRASKAREQSEATEAFLQARRDEEERNSSDS